MSVKYIQIISDFLLNRTDPSDYVICLNTLYEQFTLSDEFNEMTQPQRIDLLNKVRELKTLISSIVDVSKIPSANAQTPQ